MVAENTKRNIYIVISQTGTVLSRILKLITGAEYNHVSIGLNDDLHLMYSFGRKNPYNPFYGGFVLESPDFGTFKRFSNTKVKILEIEIDEDKYNAITKQIEYMVENNKQYGYNYIGLCMAWFKIVLKFQKRYYCSEFVKEILVKYSVEGNDILGEIPQPIHFLDLPNTNLIYTGKLKDYTDSSLSFNVN